MKVKRNTLLLIACLVWSAAGFNILRIGIAAYPGFLTALNVLLSGLGLAAAGRHSIRSKLWRGVLCRHSR